MSLSPHRHHPGEVGVIGNDQAVIGYDEITRLIAVPCLHRIMEVPLGDRNIQK